MNSLSNMRIGKKLAIAFGCSLSLLIVMVGLSIWGIHSLNNAASEKFEAKQQQSISNAIEADLGQLALNLAFACNSEQEMAEDIEAVLKFRKSYLEEMTELKQFVDTDEDRRLYSSLEHAINSFRESNLKIINLLQSAKRDEALRLYNATAKKSMQAVSAIVEDYQAMAERDMEAQAKEANRVISRVTYTLFATAIISVAVCILFSILITRSITKPLEVAVKHLDDVAQGNISRDLPTELLSRGDESGLLAKAMQTMSANLRRVIKEIQSNIHLLSASSAELSANSGQMSENSRHAAEKSHAVAAGTEEMSANVVSVAAGIEETTTNLANVSSSTGQMTATIGEIATNSEKARRITSEASKQATHITEQMQQLGHAAREIDKVTETITEISSQTSLLALNATIEAARAGSAGKGFAVVANEIKELAQQTAASTEDIKSRIAGVQSSAATGISEIEKVSQTIHEVSDLVNSIAAAIEEQSTVARDIAQNIAEASTGVSDANTRFAQSSQATREIAKEISGVDQATAQITQATEEVRRSATDLSQMAEKLNTVISHFQL